MGSRCPTTRSAACAPRFIGSPLAPHQATHRAKEADVQLAAGRFIPKPGLRWAAGTLRDGFAHERGRLCGVAVTLAGRGFYVCS